MFSPTLKCLILLACALVAGSSARSLDEDVLSNVDTSKNGAHVRISSRNSEKIFNLAFSQELGDVEDCSSKKDEICLKWSEGARLSVTAGSKPSSVRVSAEGPVALSICYPLNGAHLYGGPVVNTYPAENSNITELPYITGDMTRFGAVTAVAERYWYSSKGLNLKVDPESPLFITQQKEQLCLAAKNEFPYSKDVPIRLVFETCVNAKNVREGVRCFFNSYEKPIPPAPVLSSPIWSTWVEYERAVDQSKTLSFLNEIKSHDLRYSVIELDDAWETCYGSEVFDTKKFPNAKSMVDQIHSAGAYATIWVHPFVGPGCPSLDEYAPYLVKMPNGSIGITEWWNGKNAALINFNDPNTVEWYQNRLVNIQKNYGFDSFKFDAGEAAYIPGLGKDERSVTLKHPNIFTTNYVKAASKFGPLAEIRVGSEAHNFKIMQRIQDTNSVWGAEKWGLRSVLLSVFQLSLHGYGAIMPDMVGGNCYGDKPSKELFIRWMELNTFLPIIQFSLAPWKFDQETVDITRHFVNLHYKYKDRIIKEFNDLSHPVINPIWWIDPEDTVAQGVDSEFLLGESLLVAPVLEEGAVSRDIYLPRGKWIDQNTGEQYEGPRYIRNYNAPLDVLPYFERSYE